MRTEADQKNLTCHRSMGNNVPIKCCVEHCTAWAWETVPVGTITTFHVGMEPNTQATESSQKASETKRDRAIVRLVGQGWGPLADQSAVKNGHEMVFERARAREGVCQDLQTVVEVEINS